MVHSDLFFQVCEGWPVFPESRGCPAPIAFDFATDGICCECASGVNVCEFLGRERLQVSR